MAKKKKYYVVWEGHETGIFDNWTDCQLQIKSFPGAKYKSFSTLTEAETALEQGPEDYLKKKKQPVSKKTAPLSADIIWNSLSVDAACSGNPGKMEYRGVDTATGEELFRQGPFLYGTNNIGEFLALVHALALLKKWGKNDLPVYTDSRTATKWVKAKKVNTKLKKTEQNKILFDLIKRAIYWLENNSFKNPIIKWETDDWGEIPADFGRK